MVRNRSRRQDVYDLYYLFSNSSPLTDEEKSNILISLFKKSKGRLKDGFINQTSLNNEDIKSRSQENYHQLAHEIAGDLPDFDKAFDQVKLVYESLPWEYYVHK